MTFRLFQQTGFASRLLVPWLTQQSHSSRLASFNAELVDGVPGAAWRRRPQGSCILILECFFATLRLFERTQGKCTRSF